MSEQWQAAAVDQDGGEGPPDAETWESVAVPGKPARFAGEPAVAYRTRVSDPRSGDETRAELVLEGAFAECRAYHDGTLLGSHDAYFRPARFEFDPGAENELVVECRAPRDGFGGVHATDAVPETERVPGIWWGATVCGRPANYLTDLRARPVVDDEGARIEATATVDAGDAVDDRVTLSLRPEGFRGGGAMERAEVTAAAGERATATATFELRDPAAWWPANLGPQQRYVVRAKLGASERSVTTGLRTVERDEDGLRVNGERVAARGFAVAADATPDDVEAAAEAGANLLRAHAHVPPPSFHRAATAAGVLVWQDLPLSGGASWDPERGRNLAAALEAACGHHPSVVAYGVHDDPRAPFDSPLPGGRLGRARLRYRAWRTGYDPSDASAVAAALPEDALVFPVMGPAGTDPDAAHLYPGWDYGDGGDVSWLLDAYPGLDDVVSEFGAGSLTGDGPDAVPGLDREKHDRRADDDPAASQRRQARVVKTVAEALRRRGASVLAAYALRDVAAGGGMGALAADGTRKPAYRALADSFQPACAVFDEYPRPGGVGVTVVNDAREAVDGEVTWTAGDRSGSVSVAADPGERVDAGAASIPEGAEAATLTLADGEATAVNRYDL